MPTLRDDWTVVVALDRQHADELEAVLPTWRKYKPELFERRWLAICDVLPECGMDIEAWSERLSFLSNAGVTVDVHSWGWPEELHYWSGYSWEQRIKPKVDQRQRMLAAFLKSVHGSVVSPYWLKIDTDVVATSPGNWCSAFDTTANPAIVASPWGYTKPGWWINELDRVTGPPSVADHECKSERYRHRRITGWLCWLRTDFTYSVSVDLHRACGPNLTPVFSQDTVHWYYATKWNEAVNRVRMSNFGWRHCGRRSLKQLKQIAKDALEGRYVSANG